MSIDYQFSTYDRVTIAAHPYRYVNRNAETGEHRFRSVIDSEIIEVIPKSKLTELMETPTWRYEPRYFDPEIDRSCKTEFLSLCTKKERAKVLLWHAIASVISAEHDQGNIKLSDQSLKQNADGLIENINTYIRSNHSRVRKSFKVNVTQLTKLPCSITIRKHVKIYRECNGDILAHRNKRAVYSGNSLVNTETKQFIWERIQLHIKETPDNLRNVAKMVLRDMKAENDTRLKSITPLLYVPSLRQIERYMEQIEPFQLAVLRHGYDRSRKMFSSYTKGLGAKFIGERVEIDEWEVDLLTWLIDLKIIDMLDTKTIERIPRGRRWVCVAIDTSSRVILGLRIAKSPSTDELRQLMSMVVMDKTELARAAGARGNWRHHTGIQGLAADTGPARAKEFIERVSDLGATMLFGPLGCPELRTKIERFFGTLTRNLMPYLPGQTFSNVVKKGDHNPEDTSVLTDDDLIRILICYVVDVYHNDTHAGLGGQSPASRWRDLENECGLVLPPPDRLTRCVALGVEVPVKLSNRGVLVNSNYYSSEPIREHFSKYRNAATRLRFDPQNLGIVAVEIDNKWVVAYPHEPKLEGVSLGDWVEIVKGLRTRFKVENELSADLRSDGIDRISKMTTEALERRKLHSLLPSGFSYERVAHLQDTLFKGFRFMDEGEVQTVQNDIDFGTVILPSETISGEPDEDYAESLAVTEEVNADEGKQTDWSKVDVSRWKLEDE